MSQKGKLSKPLMSTAVVMLHGTPPPPSRLYSSLPRKAWRKALLDLAPTSGAAPPPARVSVTLVYDTGASHSTGTRHCVARGKRRQSK